MPALQPPGALLATVFHIAQGLPGGQIRALSLDAEGALLVGTESGVARFDGHRFTPLPAPPGQEDAFTTALIADGERIVVATRSGLYAVDPHGDGEAVSLATWSLERVHAALVPHPAGGLLLAHEHGLFHEQDGTLTRLARGDDLMLRTVYVDRTDTIWVGGQGGLFRWQTDTERLERVDDRSVRDLIERPDGTLLVGRDDGVFAVAHPEERLGPYCYVTDLDLLGTRVVATCGDGLRLEAPDGSWERFGTQDGLHGLILTRALVDHEGLLWLGALGQGLARIDAVDVRRWSSGSGLPSDHISTLLPDADGGLWVAARGGGVHLGADRTVTPTATGSDLLSLWGQGGHTWQMRGWSAVYQDDTPIWQTSPDYAMLYPSPAGDRLYALSNLELRELLPDSGRRWPVPEGAFTAAAHDDGGGLYLSTRAAVYRVDLGAAGTAPVERVAEGPPACDLATLRWGLGVLWAGCGETLLRLTPGTNHLEAVPTTTRRPLRGLVVLDGALWGTTVEGLHQLWPPGPSLGMTDGFPTTPSMSAPPQVWRGWLALATPDGVVWIREGFLHHTARVPTVRIRSVRDGQGALISPERLGPEDTFLHLALADDSLRGPDHIAYRFRMDGGLWSAPFSEDQLQLAGLSAGTHTVEVQARTGSGAWGSAAVLALRVPTHWYLTPAFRLGLAVGMLGLAGLIWWMRSRRLRETLRRLQAQEEFRAIFGRFVAPEVAEEALAGRLSREGTRVEVTVLFADIQGFSAMTEALPPDVLLRQLNRWYTLVIAEIEAEGGVVNKLLGDAVVAIFGAPRPQPDHADRALRAAQAIQRALAAAREEALPPAGIGMSSGEVVAGPVGAPSRMEYTVIGAPVNIAARIEALTRSLGATILLSEATRRLLSQPAGLHDVGEHPLKGVRQPVRIWRA